MSRLALLLALLCLACASAAPVVPAPAPTADPPAEAPARVVEGAELAAALPARADLRAQAGRVFWRAAPGVEYEVVRARERDWLALATPIGELRAGWGLLAAWNAEPLRDLPAMLEHARAAALRADDLLLFEEELTGAYLVGRDLYVVREGVLRERDRAGLVAETRAQHEADRKRLEVAVEALVAALPRTALVPESRPAVAAILAQLPLQDIQGSLDFVPPSFARRLVRNGWLAALAAPAPLTAELRAAVLRAERLLPVAVFRGAAGEMRLVEDAFGNRVWTLATRQRVGYARLAPPPAYYSNGATTRLVVRLPPGRDPLRDATSFREAELWNGSERIARWDAARGLEHGAGWVAAFPTTGEGVEWAALSDALPPHVLITAPNGDVLALVTGHGRIDPPAIRGEADAEAFYRNAARVLPDAGHLDLLGQYLLVYAYDSPDPRRPLLIGTRTIAGDIHQTAAETLATQAGGMMRGDCDDLSELYQEITERQGRVAHMIGLPAHAALAWAEQRDGLWLTYVLQTGQPLAFPGATLEDSLELAYKSFGSGELFDLTKLEVLLRFSGENTRSSWFLSARIFADPEYARTMIDVQRDWHFQTYQRAIEKMQALITKGDDDASNFTELAGLYHYTGQYDLAAEALTEALARTPPGQTRVSMSVDRVNALYEAKRADEARALAVALRERDIPALDGEREEGLMEPRLALADALQGEHGDLGLALEILADDVRPGFVAAHAALLESLAQQPPDLETWRLATEPQRSRLRWFVSSSLSALLETREGELAARLERALLAESVGTWIDTLAFRELDPSDSVLSRYSVVARFHAVELGREEVLHRVEASPPPAIADIDHTQRGRGETQRARDFAFASISPTYWAGELAALFERKRKTLDSARAAVFAKKSLAARAPAEELGLLNRGLELEAREVRLVAALATGDEVALRARLREIKLENDRRVRMNAASWIAASARFQSLAQFERVVGIWRDEVDYKPMWFWIAWNAALAGAPDHALYVAKSAAREYRDDPAFVEEYEFMKRRFADRPSAGTPTPASSR